MSLSNENIRLNQKPPSPPPGTIPQYCPFLKNFGLDFILQRLKQLIYVWTVYGNSFWIYPVDVMGCILFCYAWDGLDWKYIQFNICLIDSFY